MAAERGFLNGKVGVEPKMYMISILICRYNRSVLKIRRNFDPSVRSSTLTCR